MLMLRLPCLLLSAPPPSTAAMPIELFHMEALEESVLLNVMREQRLFIYSFIHAPAAAAAALKKI